jgi:hypothetical protein
MPGGHRPWDELGNSLVDGIARAYEFSHEHDRLSVHTMQSCTQATRHGLTLLPQSVCSRPVMPMRECSAEHIDRAWRGIGRSAGRQVADERTSCARV